MLVLAAKAAADSQRKILWRHGQKGSSKLPDTNLQIQKSKTFLCVNQKISCI